MQHILNTNYYVFREFFLIRFPYVTLYVNKRTHI